MAIIYVHTFHAIGNSSDTKPASSTEGMVFWELDTQKIYIFHAGQWRGVLAGSGSWSPTFAETLANKTIVLNNNIIKTTSGTRGLFAFNENGEFTFVPLGTAGLFLKVNASGTGFEFADPATTGSWNPSGTETLANKTYVVENNTLKQSTPSIGALLLDNGTKFLPLQKGANNTYLGVNNSGVVQWIATSTLGGGGGGGIATTLSRPSQSGFKEGWWDGGLVADNTKAHGLLDGEISISSSNTRSILHSDTKGKYLRIPLTTDTSTGRVQVASKLFKRNYSSYFLCKFRFTHNVPFNFFAGFTTDPTSSHNNDLDLNNHDVFMIGKLKDDSKLSILRNAGTSNYTKTLLPDNFDTNQYTVELQADPTNNRFQYRVNDFGGTWINETSNIPRTNIGMGLNVSTDSETSTDHDLELYLIEAANKVM